MSCSSPLRIRPAIAAIAAIALATPAFARQPLYDPMTPPFVSWIENGASRAQIVTDEFASTGTPPAQLLNDYLEQMAGARLPIVAKPDTSRPAVFIGPAVGLSRLKDVTAAELGADGFVIASQGQDLVIAGANRLATLYGVCAFLEECLGVRWLWDNATGEIVPRIEPLRVGQVRRIEKPDFAIRWLGRKSWALRNRMNVAIAEPDEFRIVGTAHTFLDLVPPDVYYESHPEYYAMVKGARPGPPLTAAQVKAKHWQLCTSNPGVVEATAATIDALAARDPAIRMVTIGPEDTQIFCECPQCVALDEGATSAPVPYAQRYARRILIFYNQVADAVAKRRPDMLLKGLAYHTYLAPPNDPQLAPRQNLHIQFCRFMCHNHALSDAACPTNVEFSGWLKDWGRRSDRLFMYEYYNKGSWVNLHWPILHTLEADLPYLRGLGVRGVYSQYDRNLASHALGYYVAAKLLWNSRADVDALTEDFCEQAYGAAGAPMLDFNRRLERAAIDSDVHMSNQAAAAEIVKMFNVATMSALEAEIERARALAATTETQARVKLAAQGLEYTRMVTDYLREIEAIRREIPGTVTADAITTAQAKRLKQLETTRAQEIREYLTARQHYFVGGDSQMDHYIERLLKPRGVLLSWGRDDSSWRK